MLHVGDASVVVAGGWRHDTRSLGHEQDEQSLWPRHDLAHKLRLAFHQPKAPRGLRDRGHGANCGKPGGIAWHSREDQDAFAHASQMKAAGQDEGRLAEEMFPSPFPEEARPVGVCPGRIHQARHDLGGVVQASARVPERREARSRLATQVLNDGGCLADGQRGRTQGAGPGTVGRNRLLCGGGGSAAHHGHWPSRGVQPRACQGRLGLGRLGHYRVE